MVPLAPIFMLMSGALGDASPKRSSYIEQSLLLVEG